MNPSARGKSSHSETKFIQNLKYNIFAIFHFVCNGTVSKVSINVIRLVVVTEFVDIAEKR